MRSAVLCLLVLTVIACGGGGGGKKKTIVASEVIDSRGGNVEVFNPNNPLHGAMVDIPPGALSSSETITISAVSGENDAPDGALIIDLEPSGLTFSSPVQIRIPYSNDLLRDFDVPESSLSPFYYNENLDQWDPLTKQSHDSGTNTVVATSTHFSLFAVLDPVMIILSQRARRLSGEARVYVNDPQDAKRWDSAGSLLGGIYSSTGANQTRIGKGTLDSFGRTSNNCLLIHGFTSNALTFIGPDDIIEYLKANSSYDNIVAIDYPSRFPIETIARGLRNTLLDLKASPTFRTDIVAHSMGGLVARTLLEEHSGMPQYVGRLVIIGSPLEGSHIADLLAFFPLRAGATAVYPALDDLQSGSDFLRRLNSRWTPVTTEYFVIAGSRSGTGDSASDGLVRVGSARGASIPGFVVAGSLLPGNVLVAGPSAEHTALHTQARTNSVGSQLVAWLQQGQAPGIGAPTVTDPGTFVQSGTLYTLQWAGVQGATQYRIQEATNQNFSGAGEFVTSATLQPFQHDVTSATTYYYRVRAENGSSVGSFSNSVDMEVRPQALGMPFLSDPGSTVPSGTSYTVQWTSVQGASRYQLQEADNSSFLGASTFVLTNTNRPFSHSVTTDTRYYYRVRAESSSQSGSYSNAEDILVTRPSLGTPVASDPGSFVTSGTSYDVTWSSVAGATSYRIQEATNQSFTGASDFTVPTTQRQFQHSVSSTTTYYYHVRAENGSTIGSFSNVVDMEVRASTQDNPPTVTITTPTNGDIVVNNPLGEDIIASATDDRGVDRVEFEIDGAPLSADDSSPYTAIWFPYNYADGPHTISARAFDTANQSAVDSVNVIVDLTSPTVTITSPSASATVSGTVTIQANATDDRRMGEVQFYIDGGLIGRDTTAPYGIPWDTTQYANGPHEIFVDAKDFAQNSANGHRIPVTVSNVTPPREINVSPRIPSDIAWDGQNLWMVVNSGNIQKIDRMTDTGTVLSTITAPSANPRALAFDGQGIMWHTDGSTDRVYKINVSTGSVITSCNDPPTIANSAPFGLTFGNATLFLAETDTDRIYIMSTGTCGSLIGTPLSSPGPDSVAVEMVNGVLYVGDTTRDTIYMLNPSTGAVQGSRAAPGPNVIGLAFDGTFLWVADSVDKRIYRTNP